MIFSYTTSVECNIPLNVLLGIIDQFELIDIIIQKNCFMLSTKIELFKIFADLGETINLNERTFHHNHPFIRCAENIEKFTLNKPIKTPSVIISQIKNENDLRSMDISIGEEVYFLDRNTFKIYEAYVVNNMHITRYLGQFHQSNKNHAFFSPAEDFIDSFVDRRGDFHGIQLIGMVEAQPQTIIIPDNFVSQSYYFPENETYDVTNIVSGSYINSLNHLKISLNFSIKLYKRKDGVWGMPKSLPNGSIILNGMIKSITENNVDMICTSLSIVQLRRPYVDFLQPMSKVYAALFIANFNYYVIDWTVYLAPFSIKLWLSIVASAVIFMVTITIMERQYNVKMVSCSFCAINI